MTGGIQWLYVRDDETCRPLIGGADEMLKQMVEELGVGYCGRLMVRRNGECVEMVRIDERDFASLFNFLRHCRKVLEEHDRRQMRV